MTTVTGYLLTTDTGGGGPTAGDVFAPGSALDFDRDSYTAEYSGVLNYPTTLGDVQGVFYNIGGAWYFVPTDPFVAAPTEDGTASSVNAAVYGTAGNDTITAPDDSGWVLYGGTDASPTGTGNDALVGGLGDDVIYAGDGADTIYYGDGDNIVDAGDGNDQIDDVNGTNESGDDYIDAGAGNDTVWSGYGNDTILGGTGDDFLFGEEDADTFIIADDFGNDFVDGGSGTALGTDFTDTIDLSQVTVDLTVIYSGSQTGKITDGTDTISFVEIENFILGEGNDFFDAGADSIGHEYWGMGGDDEIQATTGDDTIHGGTGADGLWGDDGADLIYGDEGDDDLGGNSGDDTLYGGTGNDWLQGNAGANLIDGGDGSDTIEVFTTQASTDTIAGGEVADSSGDTIWFTGANAVSVLLSSNETGTYTAGVASGSFTGIERFVGGTATTDVLNASGATTGVSTFNISRIETIWGSAYGDTLHWANDSTSVYAAVGDGNDSVQAGRGNDTIYAGAGNDTIWAGFGNDTVTGDAGDDFLYGGYGNDTLAGGIGDDTIGVGRNSDLAYGEDGSDTFFFEHDMGANTVYGGNGGSDIDMLDFTRLFDRPVTVTWSTNESGTATDPYGSVTFYEMEGAIGSKFNDVINASVATTSKYLYGEAGNDSITGGSGDDTISGGTGNDTLLGRDGADTFLVKDGFGNDTITGGDAAGATSNFDTIDLRAVTANLTVTLTGDGTGTITDGTGTIGFSGIERIFLGAGDDVFDSTADGTGIEVHGWGGADAITTGDGADLVAGGDGDDTIRTGAGNDTIWGDSGSDTVVVVDDDTGADVIYGSEDGSDTDALLFENVAGTGGATITYAGWEYGSYGFGTATGDFWEIEQVTATAYDDVIDASASGADHVLEGLAGEDTITGGAGNDTLSGGDGDDLLDGGFGNDSVTGGAGDDTYVLVNDFGVDTVDLGSTGETTGDTVDASAITNGGVTVGWTDADTGTLTVNVHELTFTDAETFILTDYNDVFDAGLSGDGVRVDGGAANDNLTGSAADDTLIGGAGNDTLSGGSGADVIDAGDGDDRIYLADDFGDDTISGGETGETVGDRLYGNLLTSDITLTFTGDDAGTYSDGTATIAFTGIEILWTGDGDDVIDLAADTDGVTIYTQGGTDVVYSGAGDDVIHTETGGDTIWIFENSGTDTIDGGSATDTLHLADTGGVGVAVTYATEAAASYLYGDASSDGTFVSIENLYTGDGADTIDTTALAAGEAVDVRAGAGDDTYLGGAGDDTFFGDAGDDTLVIADGFGTDDFHGGETGETAGDTVDASAVTAGLSVTYTDGEDATLTDGTNRLTFVETENVVLGSGADTVDGSAATEAMAVATGDGDDKVAGGAGADALDGGAGADLIDAGGGDDTLTGGTGDDTLTGGAGDDTFTYAPGDGADTITDFNAGNTGTLSDGDSTNNDFVDLSGFYDDIWELHADQADDGVLNQSNDGVDGVDYSDNTRFLAGDSLTFTGASADGSSFTSENTGIVCFARGTRILTPAGEVPIERLRAGDRVVTADNGVQAIRWIGSRRVARSPALQPIRIAAGALGSGLPRRALFVSPQHRLVVRSRVVARMTGAREALVAAKKLTGMRGIHPDDRSGYVRYFHILCDAHEIVHADGAPAETLLPGPMARRAMGEAAWAELVAIFPEIEETLTHHLPARAVLQGPRRAHLLRRHRRNRVPLLEPID